MFGVLSLCAPARADTSSWLYAGAGPSVFDFDPGADRRLVLDLATGFGTDPSHPIIAGGLVRVLPQLGDGVDLVLTSRFTMSGYVNGGWGAAIDLGAYQRWWGEGSTGGIVNLSLGATWGVTLNLSAAMGTNDARMMLATLGIDFARLTVYRTTGQNWFYNPFPAVREER